MGSRVFLVGLFAAIIGPALFAIGLAAHQIMGCTGGGSSGPVSGCHAFGVEFNWVAALATPAFVASFFAVPAGVVCCIVGMIMMALSPSQPVGARSQFGVFGPDGRLLNLSQATLAIGQFDKAACEKLLQSFGEQSHGADTLEAVRERCVHVIREARAYAA
jgi:hypothetical protein